MLRNGVSVKELLDDINLRYPNTIDDNNKILWINEAMKELFKYMSSMAMYNTITVADTYVYSLPDDCDFDEIVSVCVSNTASPTTEADYLPYTYCGINEDLVGERYYPMLYSSEGQTLMGIYPTPTLDNLKVRVIYNRRPEEVENYTDVLQLRSDYMNAIKLYVLVKIAETGNYPDIEMANNFRADYNAIETDLQRDRMKTEAKNPLKKRCDDRWEGM